ncbi:MAG: NTPase [Candidatus Helarchaeota archaeon]
MNNLAFQKNIIITGKPGCGKSTLITKLKNILQNIGKKVGGISTPEIRENRIRKGFSIIDIFNNKKGILSHITFQTGPRVGKYRVNLSDLDNIGVNAILFAIDNCDVILLDEIGKMELFSKKFRNSVLKAFDSNNLVIATMGIRITHSFIDGINKRADIKKIFLTKENREQVFNTIKDLVIGYFEKK